MHNLSLICPVGIEGFESVMLKGAVHIIEKYKRFLYTGIYSISIDIPKHLFVNDYPHEPRNLGEKIRKFRMDSGLQIKEFAKFVGVTSDTVINWEKRNIQPLNSNYKLLKKIQSINNLD